MPSAPCAERALLVVVAHHTPADHVIRLQQCLQDLPPGVVYGVVINDHCPGEPAEAKTPATPPKARLTAPATTPPREAFAEG